MTDETHSNASKNFRSLINRVNDNSEAITITTNVNNAVLMSESDYNAIIEMIYLQQNPANSAHLKRSMNQLKKDNSVQIEINE